MSPWTKNRSGHCALSYQGGVTVLNQEFTSLERCEAVRAEVAKAAHRRYMSLESHGVLREVTQC